MLSCNYKVGCHQPRSVHERTQTRTLENTLETVPVVFKDGEDGGGEHDEDEELAGLRGGW